MNKMVILAMAMGAIFSCSAAHLMPARERSKTFNQCIGSRRCYAPFCMHEVAKHVLQSRARKEAAGIRSFLNKSEQRTELLRPSVSGLFGRNRSPMGPEALQHVQGVVHGSGKISRIGWSDVGDSLYEEGKKGFMGEVLERTAGRICPAMGGAAARALLVKNIYKK
jgi:hypothetical protein